MARLVVSLLTALGVVAMVADARAAGVVRGHVLVERAQGGPSQRVPTRPGESVADAIRRLERSPGVVRARPNHIAHAGAFTPNDPGHGAGAGWAALQWNFAGPAGVDAPGAWENLIAAGRPGGAGVVVAVLDTGVAYRTGDGFHQSPDLLRSRFVRGYDFCSRSTAREPCRGTDPRPYDENGHGTHVAGTIAQWTNNGHGVAGLAYGARIMPVRVLNRDGDGDELSISRGIRWAVDHGAHVINMSFEFGSVVRSARDIPEIVSALRHARRRGVFVVGAAGNERAPRIAFPARSRDVFAVGATTEHGCLARYSNTGAGLDLVAPGGGPDSTVDPDPVHCTPSEAPGRDIFQVTYVGRSFKRFGLPHGYEGTSMAAPHVSATAALVIASGVLGRRPSAAAIGARLKATAIDMGPPGPDTRYGAGRLNAAAATAR